MVEPNGRTVLVTGGTGGLGPAVVRLFAETGWRVVVPARKRRAEAEPAAGDVVEVHADLTDPDSVAATVETAAAESRAPLRAVVNLVGGYGAGTPVHETPYEAVERLLAINLRPTYLVTQTALPHLLEHGGAIVCVSARAALAPFPKAVGYVTSKAAVLAFANAVAADYRQQGVRCNTILPSVIDTPDNRAAQPEADFAKWVLPEEVAPVVRFLASDESAPTSGAAVPVYGRA